MLGDGARPLGRVGACVASETRHGGDVERRKRIWNLITLRDRTLFSFSFSFHFLNFIIKSRRRKLLK